MTLNPHLHIYTRSIIAAMFNTLIPEKTRSCRELRLHTPCRKFEITNMVDDQFNLTPEGISGASFSEEEIGKLTVAQLKFW